DTYTAGEDVVYTITVTNDGPSDATNVSVEDPFPAGITEGSWTSDQGGSGTGALSDVIASLADGEVVTYEVTLSVPSDFTGDLVNIVSVTSPDVTDP
ncbi:DUF11 domain-containing protein, partial [Joostella sp. CR20]|uniref:DUF11 domain-containing protein n=1 Tax=Joostella sp. CR20 TaxID=2804312 RepID=UPI00313B238F